MEQRQIVPAEVLGPEGLPDTVSKATSDHPAHKLTMEPASPPTAILKSIVACSHYSMQETVRQQEIADTPGLSKPVLVSSLKLVWGPLGADALCSP